MRYFLGVGAQKAGTTWLHDQLSRHPQIGVPETKELHYFDSVHDTRHGGESRRVFTARSLLEVLRTAPGGEQREAALAKIELLALSFAGPEKYRDHLLATAGQATEVVGEITPEYATLGEEGFRAMRETLDPKVIFVMRDPLLRYWSAVRMLASKRPGIDLEHEFAEAIGRPGIWARSDYGATLGLLERTFQAENVLVLFFEELFDETTMRRVADFLEVDEQWGWGLDVRSHEGPEREMPTISPKVRRRLGPVYDAVRQRYGDLVPGAWGVVGGFQ